MKTGDRIRRSSGNRLPASRLFIRPAVIVVVIITMFVIVLKQRPQASQARQDFLATNIDSTVSPGNDFFQYANGEWLKRNPIPEDQARWGIANLVSDDIYAQLRRISEDAAAKSARRGSAEQLIGAVWATGMDVATINAQGLAPLRPDLARIEQARSSDELMDVLASLHRRNMLADNYFTRQRVLFDDGVVDDPSNSNKRTYFLSTGGLSMGHLVYSAQDSRSATQRDAFRDYLFKTFLRLGHDDARARASADRVYEFEARLAAGTQPGLNLRRVGPQELRQLIPSVDWDRYFKRIGLSSIDSVTVNQPQFFQALDSLLRTTSLDDWKDYVRFWLIKTHAPFLDDATLGEFFAFKSAFTGQNQPPPRWWRVVWQTRNWLGLPLGTLFDERYWSKSSLARHETLGQSLRQAFMERVEDSNWLSASTKENALRKLARLKMTIGPAKRSVDFSTMDLRRDSYVMNMIRSAEWFHEVELRRLNVPVDQDATELHPVAGGGDAEYADSRNEVRLTRPTIVPGWRDDELDDAFVYGATRLGHEVAHALDSDGRQYDAYGNRSDWWRADDAAAFEKRAEALIHQYNEISPLEGLHIDGRRSLRENLADLLGLRLALDAFKKTDQFKRNERSSGVTPLQRFFLAYAYSHLGHERREALASRLRNGAAYAPNRERVNEVVRNVPEFYEAFDVKPGDRMYRPEHTRVSVW